MERAIRKLTEQEEAEQLPAMRGSERRGAHLHWSPSLLQSSNLDSHRVIPDLLSVVEQEKA
jgi:hypothetical protein